MTSDRQPTTAGESRYAKAQEYFQRKWGDLSDAEKARWEYIARKERENAH